MTPTEVIVAKTDEVKAILDNKSFDKYFKNEFDEVKDVVLINEVMKRNDEPLIIVRLLNYRDETQRKMINDKYMEMKLNHKKNLLSYIKDFMHNHIEMQYVCFLLSDSASDFYYNDEFDAERDAKLIDKVIQENDNPVIIINLLEMRTPNQRNDIKSEYKKFHANKYLIDDVLDYLPENMKDHFLNLMLESKYIIPRSDEVKNILNNESFDLYLEKEFDADKDLNLIDEVIKNEDTSMIIVRLLEYRDESQRKLINDRFKERILNDKKSLFLYIKEYMFEHIEMEYICFLLSKLN